MRQTRAERSRDEASRLRHRFTRASRDSRYWAESEERIARRSARVAKDSMDRTATEVSRLGAAKQARDNFDRGDGWRHDRLTEVDDGLDHHWARTVLSAVREGDPLAYGPELLRQARSTYAADLSRAERNEREQSAFGHQYGATSRTSTVTAGHTESSAPVTELDKALGGLRAGSYPAGRPCPLYD